MTRPFRAIVYDTETTGLIENSAIPLKNQPHVIELHAVEVLRGEDGAFKTGEEWGSLFYANELGEKTTEITGITVDMTRCAPKFATKLPELSDFFLGATHQVGHNLSYDMDMLHLELRRVGMEKAFPWPPIPICTVEHTETMKGFRLGLNDLHEELFGERFEDHHRAAPDTRATARCVVELLNRGVIRA